MKKVLSIFALFLVVVVGLGFYLGWFDFSSNDNKGKSNATFSVDNSKIETDMDKVVDKAEALGHEAVDRISPPPETAQD